MNSAPGDVSADFAAGGRTYLNNASVSLMPQQSIEAVGEFLTEYNSLGPDSAASARLVEEKIGSTRSAVSGLIGCRPDEVVLTQSTTDGINMVANGLRLAGGSNLVIRGMEHEHHSNLYPWLRMGARASVRSLPIDGDGFFAMRDLEEAVDSDTALVSLSHALYNTGAVLPVGEAGRMLRERGVRFAVDAAQTVGCMDVDAPGIGCDFMSFNGSKWLCGPMGTGIFYCSRDAAGDLEPVAVGGESAALEGGKLEYKAHPDRFQAGFRNYAGLAGLESSIRYLEGFGIGRIREKNMRLAGLLRDELSRVPGVSLYGPADPAARTSIVPFNVGGREPEYVVQRLEEQGIVLATREIGEQKIVRASPHFFNTESEIMGTVAAIRAL